MVRVDVRGRVTRFRGPSGASVFFIGCALLAQCGCAFVPFKLMLRHPAESLAALVSLIAALRSLSYETRVSPAGAFHHLCLCGFTLARFHTDQSPDPLTFWEDGEQFEPLSLSRDPAALVAQAVRRARTTRPKGVYR